MSAGRRSRGGQTGGHRAANWTATGVNQIKRTRRSAGQDKARDKSAARRPGALEEIGRRTNAEPTLAARRRKHEERTAATAHTDADPADLPSQTRERK